MQSTPNDSTEKTPPNGKNPSKGTQVKNQHSHFVESEDQAFGLFTVNRNVSSGIFVNVSIDGTPISMTLDTGASITIISEKTHKTELLQLQLHDSRMLLKTYTGEPVKICGETKVCVNYKDQQHHLPLVVVEGEGPPLFG